MRARVVMFTGLCVAAFLMGSCRPDTDRQGPDSPERSNTVTSAAQRSGGAVSPETSGFATPSTAHRVFDHEAVATGVRRVLTEDYDIDGVREVTCPEGRGVTAGNTFRCAVVISGDEQQVEITVAGDDGRYTVSPPA